MPYLYTPEQVADSVTRLAAYCHELGRDPADVPAHVFCFIAVDPDAARARRVVAEVVGANYRQDFTGRTARLLIGGTPAEVAARLQEHADAGASGIVAHVAAEPGQFAVTTRRLAEEVLPALRPH
jgi:alkanesulfonate monooxygenase SsuD/methylene tetrahydromethanopterin reductase-like flavin-dependent oxidoreductase (luciferase family)